MDILLVVLRLTHIIAAVVWVGMGITLFFFVGPAIQKAGPAGMSFARALYTQGRFSTVIGAAAGLTFLAGLLLYLVGNAMAHFTQLGNIVLGVGAIFGTLAFLHGAIILSKTTKQLGAATAALPTDGPPDPDQIAALRTLSAKAVSEQKISMTLMLIALVCMATPRYL